MHLTDVAHGAMGSYAIVGAHLPIAAGAAWSAQMRGTDQVAVCFFGDGTTNIGAFHEALNMAAVWKLPVVFVCENNLYMEYTPIGAVTAVDASGGGPGVRLRPRADRDRRQRRRRGVPRRPTRAVDRARDGRRPDADRGRSRIARRSLPRRPRRSTGPPRRSSAWLAAIRSRTTAARLLALGVSRGRLDAIEHEVARAVDAATEVAKAGREPGRAAP